MDLNLLFLYILKKKYKVLLIKNLKQKQETKQI